MNTMHKDIATLFEVIDNYGATMSVGGIDPRPYRAGLRNDVRAALRAAIDYAYERRKSLGPWHRTDELVAELMGEREPT